MAVHCKEADRAQAAGVGGHPEPPGGPLQDLFVAPTARCSAATVSPAASGSRKGRTAAARRQHQYQPLVSGAPSGSAQGGPPEAEGPPLQQGDGDDDETLDSATDTRTEEGTVG